MEELQLAAGEAEVVRPPSSGARIWRNRVGTRSGARTCAPGSILDPEHDNLRLALITPPAPAI
jgi:hypothetical protein